MARRHYSDADRAAALAVYDSTADQVHRLRDAAGKAGVPKATLRRWLVERGHMATGGTVAGASREPVTYVYAITAGDEYVKVGLSDAPVRRAWEMQTNNPLRLEIGILLAFRDRRHAREIEARLHKSLRRHRVRGEWFRCHDDVWAMFDEMCAAHSGVVLEADRIGEDSIRQALDICGVSHE